MNDLLKQSIRGIRTNPVRAALTTLGIVIGISTVILVVSAGAGFQSYVEGQVGAFGANTVFIETKIPKSIKNRSQSTDQGDASQLASPITSFKNSDINSLKELDNVSGAYGAVIGQQVTSFQGTTKNAFIFGSSADRFSIDNGKVSKGRFFTESEDNAAAQVAVLGADIADDLFGQSEPIGQTLRVGNYNFEVIGVYERRGSFGFSNDDQQVFVPLQTAQKKLLGIDHLFYGVTQLRDSSQTETTVEQMKLIMRRNHQITDPEKDDFNIQSQEQALGTFGTILSAVTMLLLAIAAISLLVGGVGIMNIMYVTVTERTAEIGLKKAVGAKPNRILTEFLLETLIISLIGSVIGIILGSLLAFLVSLVAASAGFAWKFSVPLYGVVLSVGVSALIGLVFGVFPARSASKMDPIEALRYE